MNNKRSCKYEQKREQFHFNIPFKIYMPFRNICVPDEVFIA